MSVEFVEPGAVPSEAGGPAPGAAPSSPVPGRVLGTAAAVAGALVVGAVQLTFYAVVRTAAIVDFDGTDYRVSRIPVDAFGHSTPVAVNSARGVSLSDFTLQVSRPDGISYGPWWLGLGVALLVVGAWCLVRPRSAAPAAVVAALGGLLLGSVGAAWLAARNVATDSVPQIRFTATPALGLWFLVAAGGLALLAGLARALAPHVHRHRAP